VTGCKARLFSDAPKGKASAQIYSLVDIAKVNEHKSYTWPRHVLDAPRTRVVAARFVGRILRSVAVVLLLAKDVTLDTNRF
jgi:hypothetical protein